MGPIVIRRFVVQRCLPISFQYIHFRYSSLVSPLLGSLTDEAYDLTRSFSGSQRTAGVSSVRPNPSVSPNDRAEDIKGVPPLRCCEIEKSMTRLRSRWDGTIARCAKTFWKEVGGGRYPMSCSGLYDYCLRGAISLSYGRRAGLFLGGVEHITSISS